jgi:hypothetical protein
MLFVPHGTSLPRGAARINAASRVAATLDLAPFPYASRFTGYPWATAGRWRAFYETARPASYIERIHWLPPFCLPLNVSRATIARITSKVTQIGITMTYARIGWWRFSIKAKEIPTTTTAKASNSENNAIRRIIRANLPPVVRRCANRNRQPHSRLLKKLLKSCDQPRRWKAMQKKVWKSCWRSRSRSCNMTIELLSGQASTSVFIAATSLDSQAPKRPTVALTVLLYHCGNG